MINTSTLRPGLLVGLSTSISGNVKYRTQIIEEEHLTESGAEAARWETERTITDPAEHEAAKKVRSAARNDIVRVCAASAFGLLCPENKVADLEAGLATARRRVEAFNAMAQVTRLSVNVLTGRIASDDVEAVRAINSEVRDLLSQMERGIQRVDVKAIRDAADAAKALGSMLSPEAAERVQTAIDVARQQARLIVKAGEQAATAIDQAAIAKITESRAAFLDFDEAREVAAPQEVGLGLDLMPTEPEPVTVTHTTTELEF
jgi:hypothetical protein